MFRTLHRVRGASAVGATGPGTVGPFGRWPDLEAAEPDEDDGLDDKQHDQPEGEPK